MTAGRPAAFLDRDGTIVRDTAYLRDPADVELIPGAAHAIALLNAANIPVIVVTNQSGIARGLLTEAEYHRVAGRLDELLAAEGARIDATYFCPHLPEISGSCECRKPGVLLYRRAIADHHLDARRSAFFGDRARDVAAAEILGGLGYLIPSDATTGEDLAAAVGPVQQATTLGEAIGDAFGVTALPDRR